MDSAELNGKIAEKQAEYRARDLPLPDNYTLMNEVLAEAGDITKEEGPPPGEETLLDAKGYENVGDTSVAGFEKKDGE